MIHLPRPLLSQITAAAEQAYPLECCGLLIGRNRGITRIAPSPNKDQSGGRDRFEIDPKLRFNLMRELEDSPESIIGHYHTHPDHEAIPSPRDLEMAWEPNLIWLIVAVKNGKAEKSAAYLLDKDKESFQEIALNIPNEDFQTR